MSGALKLGSGAMKLSRAVRLARHLAAGSLLCAVVANVARSLHQMDERIVVGLGGKWSRQQEGLTTERMDALAADSRVVAALWWVVGAQWAVWREARVLRLLNPMLRLDGQNRIRTAAIVIAIAVLTHASVLAMLGVPVGAGGWGIRAGLVAASAIAIWRPEALAAAWKDRKTHWH